MHAHAGAKFAFGRKVSLKEFRGQADAVILALGAHNSTPLKLAKGTAINALKDGVIFCELLAPVSLDGGKLLCRRMILAETDKDGRRSERETDETVEIPCDTLIAAMPPCGACALPAAIWRADATGVKVDVEFYRSEGIEQSMRTERLCWILRHAGHQLGKFTR